MAKKRHDPSKDNPLARAVIDGLGGTMATAQIFGIKPPSVSAWLESGIPQARLMYLDVAYPEVMRKARKVTNGEVDRAAASDDAQPPVGGRLPRNQKRARVHSRAI